MIEGLQQYSRPTILTVKGGRARNQAISQRKKLRRMQLYLGGHSLKRVKTVRNTWKIPEQVLKQKQICHSPKQLCEILLSSLQKILCSYSRQRIFLLSEAPKNIYQYCWRNLHFLVTQFTTLAYLRLVGICDKIIMRYALASILLSKQLSRNTLE